MKDLDEAAIKAEIDKITQQVDDIMKRVEELYPPENRPPDADPPTDADAHRQDPLS
jgi:hypothetical protein